MKTVQTIRIHRHHNHVAISMDEGPTRYLSSDMVYRLIKQLKDYGEDVDKIHFTSSKLGSIGLKITD